MADYYYLLDANLLNGHIRPALTLARQRRSFEPCRELCVSLRPQVEAFSARYHLGVQEPLLLQVAKGLPFDRQYWLALVGEVLFYAAEEIPELQTCPETLGCLLAPGVDCPSSVSRQHLAPVEQVHYGSQELVFGTATYRPDHAGYNSPEDVHRLCDYLAGIDPNQWRPDTLSMLPNLESEEDREEELAFVREWFPALYQMYRRAAENQQVIVYEDL